MTTMFTSSSPCFCTFECRPLQIAEISWTHNWPRRGMCWRRFSWALPVSPPTVLKLSELKQAETSTWIIKLLQEKVLELQILPNAPRVAEQ